MACTVARFLDIACVNIKNKIAHRDNEIYQGKPVGLNNKTKVKLDHAETNGGQGAHINIYLCF